MLLLTVSPRWTVDSIIEWSGIGACMKSPRSLTAPVSKTILDYLGPS
jgi:hypothetical protein